MLERIWSKYSLRLLRRHLIWRSFRSRHKLNSVSDKTAGISSDAILAITVLRNEILRLPHFLKHYRSLGVEHFLIVDNGSDDGSVDYLTDQPDVSLWQTDASYKKARFGLDWSSWLLMHYGSGKWCLTVDADELLVYPECEGQSLTALTQYLDRSGVPAMGALMLDLYPDGPIDSAIYERGDDPTSTLTHLDSGPYHAKRQQPRGNLWLQGGARERVFFADNPKAGPTLNKLPLVKWHWRYAYVNSTHSILPARMNALYDGPWDARLCGVLLHTKFLHCAVEKSKEDKTRRQHFRDPDALASYTDAVSAAPNLFGETSVKYKNPAQLEALNLMSRGDWDS